MATKSQRRILVVYDSLFGNTQKVAEAVGEVLTRFGRVETKKVTEISELGQIDLLVVGTPVHGGRPSQPISRFLAGLSSQSLVGVKVAGFDTRMSVEGQSGFLKLIIKFFGGATDGLRKALEVRGGEAVGFESFMVEGKKGPLKKGELTRAEKWAAQLLI